MNKNYVVKFWDMWILLEKVSLLSKATSYIAALRCSERMHDKTYGPTWLSGPRPFELASLREFVSQKTTDLEIVGEKKIKVCHVVQVEFNDLNVFFFTTNN